uniref:histidine kinase n=1 Tax=Anthurium amnicola TaxID=1678845 RepID=A0A1D1YY84_9ARAE
MSYLQAFGFDLEVNYLLFIFCWWVFSEIPMNWFLNGKFMEHKDAFLGDNSKAWLECCKKLSLRGWKNHLYCHYFGSKKLRESWWRKLLLLWVISGFLVSVWIFWFMNSQAVDKRRETLASMCDERARMLQDQFNVSMNHLQALAILISTFHHSKVPSAIDQITFARYTERTAFERPLTSGVAYAVKVLHSDREQFEKLQGWTIKRIDSQEQSPARDDDFATESQETSPIQEEYAPVIFAQDTIKHVVSLDMLSGKEDRDNILRARKSGKGVLTAPLRLIKTNRLGVILTFAVYKRELPSNAAPNVRVQAAIGYLGGVFDIGSLVDKLLHQLASKQSITVNVYDTTNPLEPISMYGSNLTAFGSGIYHNSSLHFGDPLRKHEMHCRFTQKPLLPWLAITTSIGTLVIVLLVGYIFNATVNRIAKVEDDYRKMMELKKRAETADIAKSQFLATVSHEIRTPMNGVLGMLQMLMDTDLDVTQQDYVRTAQASGKTLVSLINEVLDQAKIESGKLELEAVQFDLRVILDDVLSLFSGKSQEKGIELAVYISDKVPEVLIGDPGRMRQIITNLMGNSIKFTEKGHIFVTVHLAEEVINSLEVEREFPSTNTLSGFPVADKKRSWESFNIFNPVGTIFQQSSTTSSYSINLIISVEDTGVGIPREAQSRVFTPFMQVGPSISRIHGGTGIGLSISKCLVGLMKGEIGFVSEPQIGSTFSFTAVLNRGHSDSDGYRSSEFQGMTALVVDPRPIRAKVTMYNLQRLGIGVDIVGDLNIALSRITVGKHSVNMILIDREEWFKNSDIWPSFLNPSRRFDQPEYPKFFLLANPTSSSKVNAVASTEYVPTVIMKPLRASMLAVSLQLVMGGGEKESYRNGRLPPSSLCGLLRGKNILVVDDNIVNLRVAAGALKKYGAEVACAESGKKAIALLKPPHKFDACFMDIQMPEMDGYKHFIH